MEVDAAGAWTRFINKGKVMNLPKIDISALPDLNTLTGISGSRADSGHNQSIDDSLIDVMVFVYEVTHSG